MATKGWKKLVATLRKKKGVKDPEALAAWIKRNNEARRRGESMIPVPAQLVESSSLISRIMEGKDVVKLIQELHDPYDEGEFQEGLRKVGESLVKCCRSLDDLRTMIGLPDDQAKQLDEATQKCSEAVKSVKVMLHDSMNKPPETLDPASPDEPKGDLEDDEPEAPRADVDVYKPECGDPMLGEPQRSQQEKKRGKRSRKESMIEAVLAGVDPRNAVSEATFRSTPRHDPSIPPWKPGEPVPKGFHVVFGTLKHSRDVSKHWSDDPHRLETRAWKLTAKAHKTGKPEDHDRAREAHEAAALRHDEIGSWQGASHPPREQPLPGHKTMSDIHRAQAKEHEGKTGEVVQQAIDKSKEPAYFDYTRVDEPSKGESVMSKASRALIESVMQGADPRDAIREDDVPAWKPGQPVPEGYLVVFGRLVKHADIRHHVPAAHADMPHKPSMQHVRAHQATTKAMDLKAKADSSNSPDDHARAADAFYQAAELHGQLGVTPGHRRHADDLMKLGREHDTKAGD